MIFSSPFCCAQEFAHLRATDGSTFVENSHYQYFYIWKFSNYFSRSLISRLTIRTRLSLSILTNVCQNDLYRFQSLKFVKNPPIDIIIHCIYVKCCAKVCVKSVNELSISCHAICYVQLLAFCCAKLSTRFCCTKMHSNNSLKHNFKIYNSIRVLSSHNHCD